MLVASALPAFASQISLTWNDNSSDETNFKIERAGANMVFSQIATVGANVTVYSDTSVSQSTQYWYRVRASNSRGDSAYTNVVPAAAEVVSGMREVPNVVGLTQASATTTLTSAGLVLGMVSTANSNTVPTGNVIAQDPVSATSVSIGSSVNLIVSAGASGITEGGSDTSFVTTTSTGTLRNDYSGWVGMRVSIGSTPVTVTQLGRWMAWGNTGTHVVKFVRASDGVDVPGGAASISMSGGTVDQFRYGALGNPVTLAANTSYFLLSQEAANGDRWCERDTTLSTSGAAAATGAAWGSGPGDWHIEGGANESYVPVNFVYSTSVSPPTSGQPYVTSAATGTLRNDYSGWVGMRVSIGSTPVTVTQLGRWMAWGNTGTHVVKFVRASDGVDVPGGAASISMSGGTVDQFRYGALGNPVTLAANTSYFLLSQEAANGDRWCERDTTLSTSGAAAATGAAWGSGPGDWHIEGGANESYVPVNFVYSTSVSPPTSGQPYVTSAATGTLRNDYSGWVGMRVSIGSTPVTVTQLGRWMAWGNTGTHVVKFVRASDGVDVPGGAASISMSGGTVGQFRYGALGNPVTLAANTSYFLLSQEAANGDRWCERNTTLSTSGAAAATGAAWGSGPGDWHIEGGANESYVPVNFVYSTSVSPPTSGQPYVTSAATGTLRNDYSGWVGMRVSIGSTPVTVTQLGRWMAWGNTGTHVVKFVRASDGVDVPGGAASVSMSGGTVGQFRYGALGNPVTLAANTSYFLLSQEAANGDRWCERDTTLSTSGAAAATGAAWGSGPGDWHIEGGANESYVPVNFVYSTSVSPPTSGQPYVTSAATGTLRNDYSGWVGMRVSIGSTPVTVTQLGRWMAWGNTGTHVVKFVRASDGVDVPGGAASISMSGGTVGQFRYGALGNPVTLAANTSYFLLSQEAANGDRWYERDTTLSTSGAAAATGAAWGSGPGDWHIEGGANESYVPVNFVY